MAHTTVRLPVAVHDKLQALARSEARPMSSVVEDAIEVYRRQRVLEEINAGYAAVMKEAGAAASLREEYASLEGTLGDGLIAAEGRVEYGGAPARGRGGERPAKSTAAKAGAKGTRASSESAASRQSGKARSRSRR